MAGIEAAADAVSGWPAITAASVSTFLLWLTNRKKARIDESALVLTKWKEMTDSHAATLVRVELRLTQAQDTIDILRKQVFALQDEVALLKTENAGLVRQLAQIGQSTLTVLASPQNLSADMQATVDRLKGIEE